MKVFHSPMRLLLLASVFASTVELNAQNTQQLFTPLNVRLSQAGAGYGESQVIFNSNTLNLDCSQTTAPIAYLSSAASTSPANSSGNILVDNNVNVTNLTNGNGPVNVCKGGVNTSSIGPFENCFTSSYQSAASAGNLTGQNPDSFVASGGVAPIDISGLLIANSAQQIKIDLVDEGGYVANSSVYLNTNCTLGGVTGPATISGNTIPASNPTQQQLSQDFNFNTGTDKIIDFKYDLTGAESSGSLTINADGVNPIVSDSPLDPVIDYPTRVSGTPFSTSICLVHDGEVVDGNAVCKLYTLTCTTGTGSNATGAQCPASSASNEVLQDIFDGPTFDLNDILTPGGQTFHEGIGFLMASEGWEGGPCTFDPASSLQALPCPQNLMTSFTGPGLFTSTGQTTRPNSTFISIAKVPEDLTTVMVTDSSGNPVTVGPGNWINNANPYVKLSSQAPNLVGTGLPGAATFVPSPIKSITFGVSAANSVPVPGTAIPGETTVTNPSDCLDPAATTFTTPVQQLVGLNEGATLVHYYAQDCAGTQELKFTKDQSGSYSTGFYTFPINVDTAAPVIATGPTLSPAGPYYQGETVTATFQCTDALSGIVQCGGQNYESGVADTGTLTASVPTTGSGSQTFTVVAKDAAGNQTSQSVTYQVQSVDAQVQLSISPLTVTYPLGTNLTVKVAKINGFVPSGTVQIQDNGSPVATLTLSKGAAYYYLKGLSAGTHQLTAFYSGDAHNAAGTSAAVALKVLPVPVTLALSCWNTPYPYGADFQCAVNASSNAGAPLGSITYVYDGQPAVTVPLVSGAATIKIAKPPVGSHSLSVSYAAQTNYAAAGPKVQSFSVTPAPVIVQFTPSAWYVTGGNLTLTAAVQSSSAGAPNATGSVTFKRGTTVLGTSPVNASGVAAITIAASTLPNGNDVLTATYSGGTNYATGSTSITVQVAH
ncbi:MAG TPA: Ig-like domain-containing protein [Terracidiphilus sp.]|nr:Ig-like domain-containing protein [Terracidiphilus sp.]